MTAFVSHLPNYVPNHVLEDWQVALSILAPTI
jgi:hypothetical protein